MSLLELEAPVRVSSCFSDRCRSLTDHVQYEVASSLAVMPSLWALELAREHRLSTYDACYLELAEHMGLPLATLDTELRKAAKKVGVELVEAP